MPHTHVVHLQLPVDFNNAPFDKQLQKLSIHIRTICERLAQSQIQSDEWIIAWHEYGLSNESNRYITSEQKKKLKTIMQKITSEYPKLMIVSGTVATKRTIVKKENPDEKASASDEKVSNILQSYVKNDKGNGYLLFLLNEVKHVLSSKEFIVVRNTAYVFSKGLCIKRHDKLAPIHETEGLENAIFRLGIGRSQENQINPRLFLQICVEHNEGYFINPSKNIPLIQLIISNSTNCNVQKCLSRYVIHIDKYYPTLLLTEISKENLEVNVSSYNMNSGQIVPIEPTTLYSHAFQTLKENILTDEIEFHQFVNEEESLISLNVNELKKLVLNNKNQHIFSPADYMLFLKYTLDIHNVIAARQFAIGLSILLKGTAEENSTFKDFQHYLNDLLKMDDMQFKSEIQHTNNDMNFENIKKLYLTAQYKLNESALSDLNKIKNEAEEQFKFSNYFNSQKFDNFITERYTSLKTKIVNTIEMLRSSFPDISLSYEQNFNQILTDKSSYDLKKLADVNEQLQTVKAKMQLQAIINAKEFLKIILHHPVFKTNLSTSQLHKQYRQLEKLINDCNNSSNLENFRKLHISLSIYDYIIRTFAPYMQKSIEAKDNHLFDYIELLINAECALLKNEAFLGRQRLGEIKQRAEYELSLTGKFDPTGFKEFIYNCEKKLFSCTQFSKRSREDDVQNNTLFESKRKNSNS